MSDTSNGYPPANQPPFPSGAQNPGFAQPQQPAYPTSPQQGMHSQPGMPPQYPGAQGQPGMAPGSPGYPSPQMGYGGAPAPGAVKYDPNGKPKYPGLYLTAIIVLSVGLAAAIFSVIMSFNDAQTVANLLGDDHELTAKVRLLTWISVATLAINSVAFFGIVKGTGWGRILYTAVFVVNVTVVLIVVSGIEGINFFSGGNLLPLILPILVIAVLWMPASTAYLKAMDQWRSRAAGMPMR